MIVLSIFASQLITPKLHMKTKDCMSCFSWFTLPCLSQVECVLLDFTLTDLNFTSQGGELHISKWNSARHLLLAISRVILGSDLTPSRMQAESHWCDLQSNVPKQLSRVFCDVREGSRLALKTVEVIYYQEVWGSNAIFFSIFVELQQRERDSKVMW